MYRYIYGMPTNCDVNLTGVAKIKVYSNNEIRIPNHFSKKMDTFFLK